MGLTKPRAAQIYNLDYKQATRVVTTTNITLAGGAPSSVDSVSLSLNDRVLVTGQSTASQNGLYYVTTVGSGLSGTWVRTGDANQTGEIDAGMIVMVTEGSIYADTQWKLITDGVITIGVTALTFTQNYSANSISSGSSNVTVYSNSNVTISSAGTPNVLTVSSTGIVVAGSASVTGNIIPTANAIYTLGSATNVWKSLYVAGNSIYLGPLTLGATSTLLTVNGSNVVTSDSSGNILTGGLVSASGNITGGNILTSGIMSSTGNATHGNILTGGQVSATGNLSGNYLLANIAFATGYTASKIYNGTSEANIGASGGNANISIGGTSNVVVFATSGEYVSGVVSASGNITGGNIISAGQISATTTITGGNLSTFGTVNASGNITGANILTGGLISATGNITGGNIVTGANVVSNWVTPTIGVSTGGNILVGGYISVVGNLYVNNIVSQANLVVQDPLLYLTANSSYPYNYDIGFYSNFVGNPGNTYQHTGVIRDYVDNTWKIFSNVAEPSGTSLDLSTAIYDPLKIGALTVTTIASNSTISASGTITGGNILTSGIMSSTGNATHGNISTSGLISASNNLIINSPSPQAEGGQLILAWANITATGQSNSTWNIDVDGSNNLRTFYQNAAGATSVLLQANPTSNVLSFPSTAGVSATGNITGSNLITTGLVTATGNIIGGNILGGAYFYANGAAFTGGGGGSPGGANTYIQFNDNGVFNGTAGLTFIKTTNALSTTGTISASGNITGGNVLGGANVNATTHTGTSVSVTGTVTSASVVGGVITGSSTSVTGTQTAASTVGGVITGTSVSVTGAVTAASTVGGVITGSSVSVSGSIIGTNLSVGTGNITGGNIVNSGGNGIGNIGTVGGYFNTVFAKATSAQYADLAEMYCADAPYTPGTIVEFGGPTEVTMTNESHSTRVAGIISTNPSYLMNSTIDCENAVAVALTGRVPCKVVGSIRKGDRLVSSGLHPGAATILDSQQYQPGCIIGKALENYQSTEVGVIEVAVGRF